jgi:aspartyl protease
MANIARIPITNVYMEGDYTGVILVGPQKKPMNVILDTGSSALALDGTKYQPVGADQTTDLAQTDSYGDGSSWTGAVIKTQITAGTGSNSVVLNGGNAAIAYASSGNMWGNSDGILGLAYAPLDDAFTMPSNTWTTQYSDTQVRTGKPGDIAPYLTQLTDAGVTADIISFRTRRSFVHSGTGNDKTDPLNQGWMIVGGGQEATDLYTGSFLDVKVLSDEWYCTNLKEVIVGNAAPIKARINGPKGMPSNSIVDSGTNSLNLSSQLLKAIVSKFTKAQQKLLNKSIKKQQPVSGLNLSEWPTITFVLEGSTGDVSLAVPPQNYWQENTGAVGAWMSAITPGEPGLAILGLPLMNGYFTIFDGEADNGRGVIRFATAAG